MHYTILEGSPTPLPVLLCRMADRKAEELPAGEQRIDCDNFPVWECYYTKIVVYRELPARIFIEVSPRVTIGITIPGLPFATQGCRRILPICE